MKMKVVALHQHKNSLHFPALPGPGGSIPARFRSARGEFIPASGTASFETARAIRFAARAAASAFLVLSFLAAAPAHAQITISGDVVPASVANPVWDPGDMAIGNTGTGSMTISNGGTVNSGGGDGSSIANGVGSVGNVNVNGGTWNEATGLSVGLQGNGTLSLTAGAVNVNGPVEIAGAGWTPNPGTGHVTVSGGTLTTGSITVGIRGNATFNLSGGSVTNLGGTTINSGPTVTGVVTVSGGNWTMGGLVVNGGTFDLSNGTVSSSGGGIGSGTVTVSGGAWSNSANLLLGSGDGAVPGAILNLISGTISNTDASMGDQSAGNGTINVSGGTWTSSGQLKIGNSARGTLNLSGGSASAASAVLGNLSSATGTANLTGGTLTTGQVSEGLGNGTVTFNGGTLRLSGNQTNLFSGFEGGDVVLTNSGGTIDTQAFAVATALGLTGNGGLTKTGTGTLTLSGSNSYTGGTTVNGGRLNVNGSIAGNASVESGGTLAGNGTIGGNLTVSGTQAPGTSPGIQTVGGNLTYTNGSAVVEWELEANAIGLRGTNFDGINVGGNLDFAGGTTLALDFGVNVDWSNAFWNTDVTGTNGWLIFDVDGLTTQLANLTLSAPSTWLDSSNVALNIVRPGASFSLTQSGNDIYLNYSSIPEPSTYALLAAALALLALVRRRRA